MLEWIQNNAIGLITVVAIFSSPVVALRIQKKIETLKEEKQIKLGIFKTLLATRAETTSLEHVKALNMIDIEFCNEKEIIEKWNIYRQHLNSYPQSQSEQTQEDFAKKQQQWENERVENLTKLLYEMTKFFGYNFSEEILKHGAYSPLAYGMINLESMLVRKGLINLFQGNQAICVKLIGPNIDNNSK